MAKYSVKRRGLLFRLRRLGRRDGGIATVEFALVLPILLMTLFGIIELGMAWYTKQVLTNASREGARAGIVYSSPAMTAGNIQTIVQNYLNQSGFTQPVTITVTGAGGASGSPLTVTVTHSYTFNVLPGFVQSIVGPINIQGQTVMRMEGSG